MAGKKGIRNVAGMRLRKKGGRKRVQPLTAETRLIRLRELWLRELAIQGYAPSTVSTSKWAVEPFTQWAKEHSIKTPDECSGEVLRAYQAWLHDYRKPDGDALSSATQRARIGGVKRFFQWLQDCGEIAGNPADKLHLPKRPYRSLPHTLSRKEVGRLFAQPNVLDPLGLRDRAILELLYATGMRRTELVKLDREDVELDRASIWIRQGKGGKDRMLPLANTTVRWLNAYLIRSRPRLAVDQRENAFFITGYGTRFNPNYLGNWMRRLMTKAGIRKPGACHLFRHSCATHMLDNGADLRCIQQLLGHSRLDTTQIYTEVTIRHLRMVYNATHPSVRKR